MMHSSAGAVPLIYFTRAKRLSKSSLVPGNRGYAKTEFKREGTKAGRPFQFVELRGTLVRGVGNTIVVACFKYLL